MASPWPYLSPTCSPLIVKLLLNAITSPSVRTGAPAGSLARYEFRSRLNPKSRTVEQFAGIGRPPAPRELAPTFRVGFLRRAPPTSPLPRSIHISAVLIRSLHPLAPARMGWCPS